MALTFRATGKLGELLQQFKAQFLSQLTPEDLEKQVILSIREESEEAPERDAEWLKERLVEVIDNE